MQTLPSSQLIEQPGVLQLCVQSSPFLQTHAAPAAHVLVDVGPASGTEPFEPLAPEEEPLPPLPPVPPLPPDEELAPVSSVSPLPLQPDATTPTVATARTKPTKRARPPNHECKFTPREYEPTCHLWIRFGAGGVMEVSAECG